LAPVFEGRRAVPAFCDKLEALRGELTRMAAKPYVRDLGVEPARRALELVRLRLLRGMPHRVCDCESNEDCPQCDRDQWTSIQRTLQITGRLPEDLSEAG
jgi:hypothetical protein